MKLTTAPRRGKKASCCDTVQAKVHAKQSLFLTKEEARYVTPKNWPEAAAAKAQQ